MVSFIVACSQVCFFRANFFLPYVVGISIHKTKLKISPNFSNINPSFNDYAKHKHVRQNLVDRVQNLAESIYEHVLRI